VYLKTREVQWETTDHHRQVAGVDGEWTARFTHDCGGSMPDPRDLPQP
jgi:hypothetical protein